MFQTAVGLITLVHAVMEAITDEAQVEAEPLITQVLVPGTALCSAGRDGQAGSGVPWGILPCPGALGVMGDPPVLPTACPQRGVLAVPGGRGTHSRWEPQHGSGH